MKEEAEKLSEAMGLMAETGITTKELSKAMKEISKVFYKITLEAIKRLAKERNISFEEAEGLYFGELKGRRINIDGSRLKGRSRWILKK